MGLCLGDSVTSPGVLPLVLPERKNLPMCLEKKGVGENIPSVFRIQWVGKIKKLVEDFLG